MEILASITGNSGPTVSGLAKYWLIQVIEMIETVLLLYPLNVAILVLLVVVVIYKVLNRAFSSKKFHAKYRPLQHKQNFINEVKQTKKEMRDIQIEILSIRKKIANQQQELQHQAEQECQDFEQQPQEGLKASGRQISDLKKKENLTQVENDIRAKIEEGQESMNFNCALESELKKSMSEMLATLKKLNTPSA